MVSPAASHLAGIRGSPLFLHRRGHLHQINQPQSIPFGGWNGTEKVSFTISTVTKFMFFFSFFFFLFSFFLSKVVLDSPFRRLEFCKSFLEGKYLLNSVLTQFLPNSSKWGPGSHTGYAGSATHMVICLYPTICTGGQLGSFRAMYKVQKLPQMCSCWCMDV